MPLIALGLVAIGAAVYHRSAACGAMGAALVSIPTAVWVLLRVSLRGVSLSRIVATRAFEGDHVQVKLLLHNGSRLPLFLPRVSDFFEPEMHAQKDVLFPSRVLPGETEEQGYTGDCASPRGVYSAGPAAVSISDPLGWFQVQKTFPALSPIKVYPKYQELGAREKLGDCLSLVLDDLTRSWLGESNEFFAVREYRIGDPLRRIHWGLTAHRGSPVVRELTRNTVGDLCIFLDLYRYAFLGIGRGSSLELGVRIAASLSAHALRRGYRVQMVARGARDFRVQPGGTIGHFQTLLDALVEVKPDGETPLDDLLAATAREARPGSAVVIPVSPYLRESAAFESRVLSLRRTGARVILIVFDDTTFRSLYESPRPDRPVDDFIERMTALGMEPYRVPCGASLPLVFAEGGSSRA